MSPGSHRPDAGVPTGVPGHLGPFHILGVLGEGGSGVVYAARWGHREVALKVLHPTLVATDRERSRFFSEAKLLSEVTHPSVVKVLNVGALPDGRPYLAMEKLEGETLTARLARGPLTVDAALALFDQIAGAVAALHTGGLIHRDLKPENVMLTGGGNFAVLLDFGIAKELDAPASTVTQDGGVRGTPAYMAPERFFGQPANPRTDIYELGVLLYAMVTGALPWANHADPTARLNPRRPSDIGVALPGRLEGELLMALSTRPESRPASVGELMQGIVQAYQGVPTASARRTADISSPQQPRTTADVSRPAAPPVAQSSVPSASAAPNAIAGAPPPISGPRSTPIGGAGVRQYGNYMTPLAHAPTVHAQQTGPASVHTTTALTPARRRVWPVAALVVAVSALVGGGVWLAMRGDGGGAKATAEDKAPAVAATDAGPSVAETTADAAPVTNTPAPPITDGARTLIAPRTGDDSGLALAPQYHPRGTRLLVGLRVRELVRNKAFGPMLLAQRDNPKFAMLSLFNKLCDINFLSDIDWVSIGITDQKNDEFDLVAAGNWDRAKIEDCLAKNTDGKGVERHGALTYVKGESPTWVGWIDDRTLFYTTRAKATKKWMSARLARKSPATSDKRLAHIFKGMDLMSSIWLVGDPNEVSSGGLIKGVPDPRTIYAAITLAAGLSGDIGLRYGDPTSAAKARDRLAAELAKLKADAIGQMLLGKTKVTISKRTVRIAGQLDPAMTSVLAMAMGEALKQQQKK